MNAIASRVGQFKVVIIQIILYHEILVHLVIRNITIAVMTMNLLSKTVLKPLLARIGDCRVEPSWVLIACILPVEQHFHLI